MLRAGRDTGYSRERLYPGLKSHRALAVTHPLSGKSLSTPLGSCVSPGSYPAFHAAAAQPPYHIPAKGQRL